MKKTDIHIRVSEDEKKKIKSLAEEKKLSITDFILESTLKENSPKEKSKIYGEINDIRMKNFKVGNNINQLAKRVNSNKNLSKTDFENFENLFSEFQNLLSEQNKLLKKIYLKFRQ